MARLRPEFDLQAHRGGAGLVTENTLAAFEHALRLGVTTLELDVHLTRDLVPVIAHDPLLPGAEGHIAALTLEQLRELDVGAVRADEFPGQRSVPGTVIATLGDFFAMVDGLNADRVLFNIEAKYDALAPETGASREDFVQRMCAAMADHADRVTVQSFDWTTLGMFRDAGLGFATSVLFSPKYLMLDKPEPSPWLGELRLADFADDVIAAVSSCRFDQISPIHGSPFRAGVDDPRYRPFAANLIDAAHTAGLTVVPYVVDDKPTMTALVEAGADGLITNYPDRLREVLAELGEPLPPPI